MNSIKKETQHSESLFPIVSDLKKNKHFGHHLEINILPLTQKVCSYDCKYCHLGKTTTKINAVKTLNFPSGAEIISSINEKFDEIMLGGQKIDTLLISGNGEATLHPQFSEIAFDLNLWKAEKASHINLTLLTNGAHFMTKKSMASTEKFDDVFLKIDCSDDITLKKLNAPIVRQNLEKLIFAAQKIHNLSVQTMLVSGQISNTTDEHFGDLLEVLGMLKPKKILLTTLKQNYADLKPTSDIILYNLAQKLRKRLTSQIFIDL